MTTSGKLPTRGLISAGRRVWDRGRGPESGQTEARDSRESLRNSFSMIGARRVPIGRERAVSGEVAMAAVAG